MRQAFLQKLGRHPHTTLNNISSTTRSTQTDMSFQTAGQPQSLLIWIVFNTCQPPRAFLSLWRFLEAIFRDFKRKNRINHKGAVMVGPPTLFTTILTAIARPHSFDASLRNSYVIIYY